MRTKFDSEITEKLYELSLDGTSEELGNVQDFGWYGLLLNTGIENAEYAILYEDSNGFVYSYIYQSENAIMEEWESLQIQERIYYDSV